MPLEAEVDLEAIRLLGHVRRLGSIQGVSRETGIARATVRSKLDQLQASVGVALMHRSRAGVELTEAGAVLADRSRELLGQLDTLVETAREVATDPPRPIRVGIPLGMPPESQLLSLKALRGMWPDVRMQLCVRDSGVPNAALGCDFYVILGPAQLKGPFTCLKVGTVNLSLFASRDYLAAHPPIERVEDLAAHPLLVWQAPDEDPPTHLPLANRPDLAIEPIFVSNDAHTIHELAGAQAGIGYAPHAQGPVAFGPALETVLPGVVGKPLPFRLLVADAVAESPRVRRLAQIVEEMSRGLAGG